MTRQRAEAWTVEDTLTRSQNQEEWKSRFTRLMIKYGFCAQCDCTLEYAVKVYTGLHPNFPPKVLRCKCGKMQALYKEFGLYGPCDRCSSLPEPTETATKLGHKYTAWVCGCGWLRAQLKYGNPAKVVV